MDKFIVDFAVNPFAITMFERDFKPLTSLAGFFDWYNTASYCGAFINPAIVEIMKLGDMLAIQEQLRSLGILTLDSLTGYEDPRPKVCETGYKND